MVAQDSPYRILYRDIDQMGVLYYSRYLDLFEMGRTEWARSQGFSYRDMEEVLGLMLPVTEATCRYRDGLRFDEIAIVRTSIAAWSRTTIRYGFEVFEQESQRLCATGEVELACVTRDTKKPHILPEAFLEIMEKVAADKKGRRRKR
ncbi:MAG: thioesterase family protein [Planctomycetota bacterium]